jgi:hypothetical protein
MDIARPHLDIESQILVHLQPDIVLGLMLKARSFHVNVV